MLVIKDTAKISIDYPIEKYADKEKILYFDIETTGLSKSAIILKDCAKGD